MRGSKVRWCVVASLGVAMVARAEEKQDRVNVNAGAGLFSKYVWRGQNRVDDWVLQPSISVGYRGLTGSIWANMDLHGDVVDKRDFTEVDCSVDYSNTFPGQDVFGYSFGLICYDFPNTRVPATREGARSGQIGDGKIFILDLSECVRIRTGERGGEAIG